MSDHKLLMYVFRTIMNCNTILWYKTIILYCNSFLIYYKLTDFLILFTYYVLSMVKKLFTSLLIVVFSLLHLWTIFAQYTTTPTIVEFSEKQGQTFLPSNQCFDWGLQVYDNYRMYMGDRSRPYDSYVKATSTRYVDWFRFDNGKTNIELRNWSVDIFDVQWSFNIKSYGNPRNVWETTLWVRNNSGMVAVGHHPSDTKQPGAQ